MKKLLCFILLSSLSSDAEELNKKLQLDKISPKAVKSSQKESNDGIGVSVIKQLIDHQKSFTHRNRDCRQPVKGHMMELGSSCFIEFRRSNDAKTTITCSLFEFSEANIQIQITIESKGSSRYWVSRDKLLISKFRTLLTK